MVTLQVKLLLHLYDLVMLFYSKSRFFVRVHVWEVYAFSVIYSKTADGWTDGSTDTTKCIISPLINYTVDNYNIIALLL